MYSFALVHFQTCKCIGMVNDYVEWSKYDRAAGVIGMVYLAIGPSQRT